MTHDRPSRPWRRLAAASLAWALFAVTPGAAAEPEERRRDPVRAAAVPRPAYSTIEARLVPPAAPGVVFRGPELTLESRLLDTAPLMHRISTPLGILSAHGPDWGPGAEHAMRRELTDAVRRGAERTTRRAIKDYLLEISTLESRIEEFKQRRRSGQDASGGNAEAQAEGSRFRFDFGVSHFLPEVEMRYELERADFKLSLSAAGKLRVRFRDARLGGTEVSAGFDGDDTYRLFWSFGF